MPSLSSAFGFCGEILPFVVFAVTRKKKIRACKSLDEFEIEEIWKGVLQDIENTFKQAIPDWRGDLITLRLRTYRKQKKQENQFCLAHCNSLETITTSAHWMDLN